jgi:hypothetical protein
MVDVAINGHPAPVSCTRRSRGVVSMAPMGTPHQAAHLHPLPQVLCEKPLTANAEEARQVQEVAQQRGLLCREAFHYREHPLAKRWAVPWGVLATGACPGLLNAGTFISLLHVQPHLLAFTLQAARAGAWPWAAGQARW